MNATKINPVYPAGNKQEGDKLSAQEWNDATGAIHTAQETINNLIDNDPVTHRACTDTDEFVRFEKDNGDVLAQIDENGVTAPGFKTTEGEEITPHPSLVDRKLTLFEPEFYSVVKGRRVDAYGVGQAWYDRFILCHISDLHGYFPQITETVKVAQGRCAAIVNTGDDGSGVVLTPTERQLEVLGDIRSAVVRGGNSLPYIVTAGNHDVTNITKKQYFDIMCDLMNEYSDDIVWGDEENNRWYGYLDIDTAAQGTFRIVFLDPCDYDDGAFPDTRGDITVTFSQKQIDWLIATLLDAASGNCHVITAMHYSFGDNSLRFNEEKAKPDALFYQDAFMVPDIIDAIQHKTTLSKTYTDSQGIANIVIDRDFASAGDLNFVCHLFGHIHSKNYYRCQKTDGSKVYDIAMLGEAALCTGGTALNKSLRLQGTVNDTACSFLAIDTTEKCIYRVAFGAYLNYDCSATSRITKISYNFNANQ